MHSAGEQPSEKAIAIAVVEHDGCFLVGERPPGVPLAGYAEFPGGKLHPGEAPADAARRECLEETGLDVEVLQSLGTVHHQYDHGLLVLHFMHCQLSDAKKNSPRSPFQWVAREKLASLQFPPANQSVIERLLRSDAKPLQ